jgi:hypothetical protein
MMKRNGWTVVDEPAPKPEPDLPAAKVRALLEWAEETRAEADGLSAASVTAQGAYHRGRATLADDLIARLKAMLGEEATP